MLLECLGEDDRRLAFVLVDDGAVGGLADKLQGGPRSANVDEAHDAGLCIQQGIRRLEVDLNQAPLAAAMPHSLGDLGPQDQNAIKVTKSS